MSISADSFDDLLRRSSLANKEDCAADFLDTEMKASLFTTRSTNEGPECTATAYDIEFGTLEVSVDSQKGTYRWFERETRVSCRIRISEVCAIVLLQRSSMLGRQICRWRAFMSNN
jgi:hypothetical protein